jgi:predicted RNase H-like nuclease
MIYVGVDGYRKGWVAVRVDGETRELCFYSTIAELLATTFDLAAIDMPIGLPEADERACDLEARAMLRPHSSRVFTGARRGLWDFGSRGAAHAEMKRRGETGVTCQLWNLGCKIRQLDAAMTPHRQHTVREAHPELVFLRLNNGRPLPRKKDKEGRDIRRCLLLKQGFEEIDDWLNVQRVGKGARADDVLDACAVAIAARDFSLDNVLPRGRAEKDARGLKMQIWY